MTVAVPPSDPLEALPRTAPAGLTGGQLTQAYAAKAQELGIDISPGDFQLLVEAARVLDTVNALQRAIEADGEVITTETGSRVNPALGAIDKQRLTLIKLLGQVRASWMYSTNGTRPSGRQPGSTHVYDGVTQRQERAAARMPQNGSHRPKRPSHASRKK